MKNGKGWERKPRIKAGDRVLIVGAGEEDLHVDDVFVVTSEPYDLCGTEVVSLHYQETGKRYTPFAVKFLRVIPKSATRPPCFRESDGLPGVGVYVTGFDVGDFIIAVRENAEGQRYWLAEDSEFGMQEFPIEDFWELNRDRAIWRIREGME